MRNITLIALLLGLLLVAAPFGKVAFAEEAEEGVEYTEEFDDAEPSVEIADEDVVIANASNWEETVGKAKLALVEFYAPWCGHCQDLAPHFAAAATQFKEIDPEVILATVDATEEKDLKEKYGIEGFPTLKLFANGEFVSDFNAERSTEGIVKWMKRRSGPLAVTADAVEALTDAEKSEEVVLVGYFKEFKGDAYDAFTKTAQAVDEVAWVQTSSAEVAKAAGLSSYGVAAVQNFKGEARTTVVAGEGDLLAFVTSNKLPPTVEFSEANSNRIFNSGIGKQLLIVASSANMAADAAVYQTFKSVAKALAGKLVFVTVDLGSEHKEPVVAYFAINEAEAEKAPVVLGFEMEGNRKFFFKGEFTVEALTEFAQSVVDGSAEPEWKSQPVPRAGEDKDGEVQIIVGKTFESIFDPTKDVLLEVYAPWCTHCKNLQATYQHVAQRFKGVESVVVAKMDGTENEHANLTLEGYPTFIFYPAAADAKPIVMGEDVDRTIKGIVAFIKDNAQSTFTLPELSEEEEKAEQDKADEELQQILKEQDGEEDHGEGVDWEGMEAGLDEMLGEDGEEAAHHEAEDEYDDGEDSPKHEEL